MGVGMTTTRPLLVRGDSDLIDDVLRLAAAAGVEVHLATDPEAARGRWALAPLVLVGADRAEALALARPSRRRDVVLVTRSPGPDDWQRGVALGVEHVVALPDAERWLIDRLADGGEGTPRNGAVVAVVGAGQGAGASTLAATLALAAAARSLRVLLVDADPIAGGLDLLLGIEEIPGARWADLADTRGRLSATALDQALPRANGVAVLSWGRDGVERATPEAMGAVLDAGARAFDLVVVDLPRSMDAAGEAALSRARDVLLVAVNHVRSAAAAARLLTSLQTRCSAVSLVVRSQPKGVDDEVLQSSLRMPFAGRLPFAAALAVRADEGEPPSVRDAYGRACGQLLPALVVTHERAS
jgi:secretion/DNA translocation related CpaE-like protein